MATFDITTDGQVGVIDFSKYVNLKALLSAGNWPRNLVPLATIAEALEARSQFGSFALHVSGGQAPVEFRDLLLFDLMQRVAGIPGGNQNSSHQLGDLFYAEGVAVGVSVGVGVTQFVPAAGVQVGVAVGS